MEFEILKHWGKLLRITQIPDRELVEAKTLLFSEIIFVNAELIPQDIRRSAYANVKDVDPDDYEFVALTDFLKGKLWTGDKPLYKHLKTKGYKNIVNTEDLVLLIERLKSR